MKRTISDFFWKWRKPSSPLLAPNDLELPVEELAWKAFDLVGDALDKAKGKFQSKVYLLEPQWRFIWVMLRLDEQVNNGGFHQFYTNMQGVFDAHIGEDIAFIESQDHKEIIGNAFQKYSGVDYRDQWKNVGKSWDYFTRGYEDKLFETEDQAYFKLEPSFPEAIGRQILNQREAFSA